MKKKLLNINYFLLILMIIFSAFGLLMIFSSSSVASILRYDKPANYFFIQQIKWIILGYIAGAFILLIPTKYYRGKYLIELAIFLVILVLSGLFLYGAIAGGAQSWYKIGHTNIQPAEPVKLILIIYLGVYYYRISLKNRISVWNMIFPLIIAGIIFVLIAMQPDLGGACIIFIITMMIFISLPIAKRQKKEVYKIAIIGAVVIAGALLLLGKNILHSYQISRILNFANPCQRYSEDTGYQVCNGYIAIHNGGLTGVGLGNSTQKYLYLPEAHTDFIFPIICEELGLIGGIIVVIGYFALLVTTLKIAKNASNLQNSIIAYGIFAYLLSHILINLLGVLGLIPLTGVPLPFLSYGGSYNICMIASLFILQKIHIESKENQVKIKIRNL